MTRKKRITHFLFPLLLVLPLLICCVPHLYYSNTGTSISHGTPGNGSLENAWQVPYKTRNSRYFSPMSYYLFGNGYVNSKVYATLEDAYEICRKTSPGIKFRIMECADRKGGKLLLHRTHRNGMSVDFMVPKIKNNRQFKFFDRMGLWHYLLGFDARGRLRPTRKVYIDFETMARHILALDDAARKNGLRVEKVILRLNLKDEFFSTESGKIVKERGIYFARHLPDAVDRMHDDHYHVDFRFSK